MRRFLKRACRTFCRPLGGALLGVFIACLIVVGPSGPAPAESASPRPLGIALIGDPHLPGNNLPAKEDLLRTIDGLGDIDRVVVLGDICKETGTAKEYAFAKDFFQRLRKPTRFIAGNHDFIYEDEVNAEGRKVKALAKGRRAKLARFAETFGMNGLYGSEGLGNYRLIYLSTDHPESGHLAELSDSQMAWFEGELASHRDQPTIVFFHAPLAGTLKTYNTNTNTPSFIAQPSGRLQDLIGKNRQLFLWVAGHMHVPATNESYSSPVNVYRNQVTVIHNTDLERQRPWTNVLYLYPDRVVVRTYDHWQKSWRPDLERTIRPPSL